MSYLPILDYSTDKAGNRYDFSLMFLQEHHVKTILGALVKQKISMQSVYENLKQNKISIPENFKDAVLDRCRNDISNIHNLILIIQDYKPEEINKDKIR